MPLLGKHGKHDREACFPMLPLKTREAREDNNVHESAQSGQKCLKHRRRLDNEGVFWF